MDTYQLHQLSSQISGQVSHPDNRDYLRMAVAAVLRHAQEGELPLFAWTLGLQQDELIAALASCFPELRPAGGQTLIALSTSQYRSLLQTAPVDFLPLKNLLTDYRSSHVQADQADWLARAIAAASFGSRHLWQDLGLPGREAVSGLMQKYFEGLYRRNTQNIRWKRFLFAELGLRQGNSDLRPPACTQCDDCRVCFPAPESRV